MRFGLLLAFLFAASPALADPRFVEVSTEECEGLRPAEIKRILELELASVSRTWRSGEPLGVELSCEGDRVRVSAIDPVTAKKLTREVSLVRARADRDRILALVVSQLFLTSWSELLIEPEPTPTIAPVEVTTVVRDAARDRARRALDLPPFGTQLALLAGPRLRGLSGPSVVGGRVAVRPGLVSGRLRLFAELGYERGGADQAVGTVSEMVATIALGVAGHWGGLCGFAAGASFGAGYATLSGDPTAGATGASASGAIADVGVFAGPSLTTGVARFGLELAGGMTFPRTVGRVVRGEDVAISGPWVGASLVGAILGGSR